MKGSGRSSSFNLIAIDRYVNLKIYKGFYNEKQII